MDRETKFTLDRITAKIPDRLAKHTSKVVYDTTEEEKARLALKSNISQAKKRRISKLLDKGAFRRRQEVVDEKTVEALDKFHTREIARARASGRLKDPMTDPFYRSRMKRLDRIQKGLETPKKQKAYTPEEIAKARQHLDPTINPKKYDSANSR